jgi:hypothetical protein
MMVDGEIVGQCWRHFIFFLKHIHLWHNVQVLWYRYEQSCRGKEKQKKRMHNSTVEMHIINHLDMQNLALGSRHRHIYTYEIGLTKQSTRIIERSSPMDPIWVHHFQIALFAHICIPSFSYFASVAYMDWGFELR